MGIDYNKRPSSSPTPAPAPPAPAAPTGPISLTKRGEKVDLSKGDSAGPIRVNLNWDQRSSAPSGGGFLKRLAGGGGAIDLDLGCLYELSDGSKGVVQALGNVFGDLERPPYVKLDKDDRSGAASDGENLFINGRHAESIRRLAVFAFIYEGAPNWSQAGGVVTIHPPSGSPIEIKLDETRDGMGMCGICLVHGSGNGFSIERQVQYVRHHGELDALYGWGMQWRAGRK